MSARAAITAMDAAAKTITVGSTTYVLTDATKITAHGKKLKLSDFKLGDTVSISFIKKGDKLEATRVTITMAAKM